MPVSKTCYALPSEQIFWPNGCYKTLTSVILEPAKVTDSAGEIKVIGKETVNPFYIAFLVSMCFLITTQIASTVAFIIALVSPPKSLSKATTLVLENPYKENNGRVPEQLALETVHNSEEDAKTQDVVTVHQNEADSDKDTRSNKCGAFADVISSKGESGFYWIGKQVAHHPKMTIVYSLLLTGTFSIGLLQRAVLGRMDVVGFLGDDDMVKHELTLVSKTFLETERFHSFMVSADNILESEKFLTAFRIENTIKALNSSAGNTLDDICTKAGKYCKARSIFELWNYNKEVIGNLSTDDIVNKINESPLISAVFGDEIDLDHVLGGVEKNEFGHIISAKIIIFRYVTSKADLKWEELFIEVGLAKYDGVTCYVNAHMSMGEEIGNDIMTELPALFAGFCLIFLYIFVMTGKMSLIEHGLFIALMGVTAAGLAMGAGIGIASCFGMKWSSLHLLIPFLVLGIGVDDMFIIIHAWKSLDDDEKMKGKSIEEKAAIALKEAGTSITVTSLTDLVAFGVGATSGLGGFASLSVYVAVCIILLFILECTFFMACVVLDHKRKEQRYDGLLLCCYKHKKSYKSPKCADREFLQTFFEDGIGRLVTKVPFMIVAVIITLAVTGLMSWGFYKLEVKYDVLWYLPEDSYFTQHEQKFLDNFNVGTPSAVYMIGIDHYSNRKNIHDLYERLHNNSNVDQRYLSSWFEAFTTWAGAVKAIEDAYADDAFKNSSVFYKSVREFLHTDGRRYLADVVFKSDVLYASRIIFNHIPASSQDKNIPIIDSVKDDCKAANLPDAFPLGDQYMVYQVARIVQDEVYRNIGISLLCVLIMVMPLLVSLQMGLWVGLCVIFTMVDVAGSFYFAGLTIELTTFLALLLTVGLSIDYAAHIGHKFLILKGDRKLRARVTLAQIGLAVFNGGFSTFLVLVFLIGSKLPSYRVLVTVFSCVIGYGLWNSLFFLPSVLAFVGPAPRSTAAEARLSMRHMKNKKNKKVESTPEEIPASS